MPRGLNRAALLALAITAWTGPLAAADAGAERCNGRDDDGDGEIDEDFPLLGQACRPVAVPELAADSLGVGECRDGRWQCDILNRNAACVGGAGPSPEICDGLDNDCDGVADDMTDIRPRGLLNEPDPEHERRAFNQPCGSATEPCRYGHWLCVEGHGRCVGGIPPVPEICDGIDNDCNGRIDDESIPADGAPATRLCAPDRTCVDTRFGSQCATRCSVEADCDGGTACMPLPIGEAGSQGYCVRDRCAACGTTVVVAADGGTICAPFESAQGGLLVPECECHGQDAGCGSPCPAGCPVGKRCLGLAGRAGCVPETNCYYFGCFAGQACHSGRCVDDPCSPNPCGRSEVCRPTRDFESHGCVPSCAGVACAASQRCEDGICVDTGCAGACEAPLVCRGDRGCAPSGCPKNGRCSDGEYCEPETGRCLDAPCEAVACPAGQRCENGQCIGNRPEPPDGAPPVDASLAPDAGSPGGKAPAAAPESASSCGCRAPGSAPAGSSWSLVLLALRAAQRSRFRVFSRRDTPSDCER